MPTFLDFGCWNFLHNIAPMKTLIIISALLCLSALHLDADETTIIINKVVINTRGIIQDPHATISDDNILSISLDASGVYYLYIENSSGVIVYTTALPANGMEYSYDLSCIGDGLFFLILKGASGEYEGCFSIKK